MLKPYLYFADRATGLLDIVRRIKVVIRFSRVSRIKNQGITVGKPHIDPLAARNRYGSQFTVSSINS